jgi:hypothetical protein
MEWLYSGVAMSSRPRRDGLAERVDRAVGVVLVVLVEGRDRLQALVEHELGVGRQRVGCRPQERRVPRVAPQASRDGQDAHGRAS